jgi:hypothetical protein
MPSLVALLAWQTKSVAGDDGQYDHSEPTDIVMRKGAPVSVAREVLTRIELLCQPGDPDVIVKALTELRALTVMRPGNDISVELQAAAYTAQLARFPADVVQAACVEWRNTSKWWPSWNELLRTTERFSAPRHSMRAALRRYLEQQGASDDGQAARTGRPHPAAA